MQLSVTEIWLRFEPGKFCFIFPLSKLNLSIKAETRTIIFEQRKKEVLVEFGEWLLEHIQYPIV